MYHNVYRHKEREPNPHMEGVRFRIPFEGGVVDVVEVKRRRATIIYIFYPATFVIVHTNLTG